MSGIYDVNVEGNSLVMCSCFGGCGAFARSHDFALARENADFSLVSLDAFGL
jgi:hypothetical protein